MEYLIFLPIPLNRSALVAFDELKRALAKASLGAMGHGVPFSVETDASDYALGAISSRGRTPVAYMLRTITACVRHYPAVEKEATTLIEAVRPWSNFLKRRCFTLVRP